MMKLVCWVLFHLIALSSIGFGEELDKTTNGSAAAAPSDNSIISVLVKSPPIQNDGIRMGLEPRAGDKSFVRDIVNRLHALDADIGKLLFNGSATSYAAASFDGPEQPDEAGNNNFRGGQKFTEILTDLDSLQDEIGGLVYNATRSRQYNILVRLRPLNTILYRIRHNLHLMRNSLVAINTVARLEKVGNSILDTTLQALMRPDASLSDEIGDNGNYDIDLDKPDDRQATSTAATTTTTTTTQPTTTPSPPTPPASSTTTAVRLRDRHSTTLSSSTSTSTTTTTTTLAPSTLQSSTTQATSSTQQAASTKRPAGSRGSTRRNNQRRRTTTTTTTTSTTTAKP